MEAKRIIMTENREAMKAKRPVRNKKFNRRAYGEEKRPPKRLFTPEIKKFLKDWLVRRRENPYPNRDEKKMLAVQTGLTYIQVCNWFANWRRKLKNAGKEPQRRTWGDLIKTYNDQVHGNVEHFSICSEDSIWEEPDTDLPMYNNNNSDRQDQCYYVSSTTETNPFSQQSISTNKYKNHIMEKYMRDCRQQNPEMDKPSMVAKWLQSAEKFRPEEGNFIDYCFDNKPQKKKKLTAYLLHGKEELDAAEALTSLANSNKSQFL